MADEPPRNREVRANAFAAHFLMPEGGVRTFLQALGKGEATRQVQEVHDGVAQVAAQKRMPPGSQELQVHDVVMLAHHFGVSYEAALCQFLNLKLIAKDRLEVLKDQNEVANGIARALQIADWDEDAHWTLAEQILALGLEAYRLGEISRRKLLELAADLEVRKGDIEQALAEDGPDEEPVDAVFPE